MKSIYKLTIILFFAPLLTYANNIKERHEKNKTIKKEFKVNKNSGLEVYNKYGNIKLTSWNKDIIEIEVTITVKGNDLDEVENKIDDIDVEFESNSDLVSARTLFLKENSSWSFWKKNSKISYQINYLIKLPETNSINIDNNYGNISLDYLSGDAKINCDYGSISISELTSTNNSINLDYCSNSNIGFIKNGKLNFDYSKITIEESENLKINSDYSTVNIEKTGSVDFNIDYGAIKLDEAVNVNVNSDYTNMKFGEIKKNLIIDSDYGGISIKKMVEGFESLDINSQYTGIRIGLDTETSFDFEIDLQYASFKGESDNMEIFTKISKPTKKYYKGKFGKGNSTSSVKIKSQYGGITFKIND